MFDMRHEGPTFITADQVADRIGMTSGAAFLAKRDDLETDHAFPLPMPTSQRPLRWRASEIDAWVDRVGRPRQVEIPEGSNVARLFSKARTA